MATVNRRSLALLGLGGLALLAGLAGALVLLGLGMPQAVAHLAPAHGMLMALGFLGTMISLERAVALGARWAAAAPLASGLGGLALLLRAPDQLAGGLLLAAGLVLVAMYVAFDRIEVALHTRVQALGAIAWPIAVTLWLGGRPVSAIVPWLAAFLVLVIAGERLELSRLGRLSGRARLTFVATLLPFVAGVALTILQRDLGLRLGGIGLLGLTAWLATHDLARRTVRMAGVTRFIALCLLIGYAWLAVGGAAWLVFGAGPTPGGYDTMLHAIFLGFVMSMVFGHAPVIVPAVLRVPLPYRPRFYAHLALLHLGLLLRIGGGDLLGDQRLWQAGGVVNVIALLLFVASSAGAAIQERSARSGSQPHRLPPRGSALQRETVRID